MEKIEWEQIPESEVKAEVEAALESSGESRKIKDFVNRDERVNQWRKVIEGLIKDIESKEDFETLTPDDIYDKIVENARNSMPQEVLDEIEAKIVSFLENEFENDQ